MDSRLAVVVAVALVLGGAGGGHGWAELPVTGTITTFDPNMDYNQSCNTGNCVSGGIRSYWKVPLATGELGYQTSKPWVLGTAPKNFLNAYQVTTYDDVGMVYTKTARDCCYLCKYWYSCQYWQFLRIGCSCAENLCFLYGEDAAAPQWVGPSAGYGITAAGAKCRIPECVDDPHLTGFHGTKYDFSGEPGKSFCLIADRSVQVNMALVGYLDNRTENAMKVVNGMAVRTWIRQMGVMWEVEGAVHTMRFVARAGKENERGEGFLERAELDGATLPQLKAGETLELAGGVSLGFQGNEKSGPYDVDIYTLKVQGLLDMKLRLRVANPMLQTAEEAYVHISVSFKSVNHSEAIHGVLGQTYRADHVKQAEKFSRVTVQTLSPVSADGESGKGFLDGRMEDYIVSDVLSSDCVFSPFGGRAMAV